jgi:putative membrane protein
MTRHVWTSWSLQPPVVVGLAGAAWGYARGVQTLWSGKRRRGVTGWQVACFIGGLLALFVAFVSPVHSLSSELLWVHMVQHVLLVLVAAPLLVVGAPLVPMTLALPLSWRRRIRQVGRIGWLRSVGHLSTRPLCAWMLSLAALWAWHAPGPYDAAVKNGAVHALEHLSFLATAILFWWVAIRPGFRRRSSGGLGGLKQGGGAERGSPPGGSEVLYVITAGIQSGALGAVLTFAGSPLYPAYTHAVARWGLTPLQDQQLAGLIMWIPAGMVYVVAAGALFVRWLLTMEREARRAEGRTGTLGVLGERP